MSIVQSRYTTRKLKEITILYECIENDDWPCLSNELFSLNTPVNFEKNLPSHGSEIPIAGRSLLTSISLITARVSLTGLNTGNDDQSVSRILLIRKLTTSRGTLFLLQCVTTLSQAWLSDKHFGILALRYAGLPENPTLEPFFTLNQKLKFAFYFKEQLSYINLTIEFSLKPRHIYQHDWLL